MSRIYIFAMANVMVALLCQNALAQTYSTREFPWPKAPELCYVIDTQVTSETEMISDLWHPVKGWTVRILEDCSTHPVERRTGRCVQHALTKVIFAHHCGTTVQPFDPHKDNKTYCFTRSGDGKPHLVMDTKNGDRYLKEVECFPRVRQKS